MSARETVPSRPAALSRDREILKTVVIINDNARITGGADKIALTSAVGLAQRGYIVHLLTAVAPIDPDLVGVENLHVHCTEQFEILNDPNRFRAITQGLWNPKAATAAKDIFRTLDPATTVVHLHLWAKALSSSPIRAAVQGGFPVACTLHDYLLACPVGTLFDHSLQAICTRKPMSLECITARCDSRSYADKLWRVTREAVQSSVGRLPAGLTDIVAISELVLDIMRSHLPADAAIHRLSNFVDLVQQPPALVATNTDFVFLGRLVKEKGPLLFAEAAASEKLPAVFLGEGDCRPQILRIMPSATISGWLPYQQSLERLRSARAMVFPSLWYEAQPLVVLEALAQGVPCIVADTSAAREMIIDGETGLLFRGGSAEDLCAKLRLLADAQYAAMLGRNAWHAYWKEPCTLERHLDGLESIYNIMLHRSLLHVTHSVASESAHTRIQT